MEPASQRDTAGRPDAPRKVQHVRHSMGTSSHGGPGRLAPRFPGERQAADQERAPAAPRHPSGTGIQIAFCHACWHRFPSCP
eukprot:scaffold85916_cov30-Tisochrysis_lutea.AAC.7